MRPNNNRPHQNSGTNHSNNRRGLQNKNKVFDSNGPDVRIRGTAHQIVEKYVTLAKDAHASGDWVAAESYLQHAEHYQRMVNSWNEEEAEFYASDSYDTNHNEDRFTTPQITNNTTPSISIEAVSIEAVSIEDDLGLPASIIGNTSNNITRTSERSTENALTDA